MSKGFRITYSALSADLTELHKEFDAALANLKSSLGYSIPSIVNGKKVESGKVNKKTSPTNTSLLIANYHVASEADLNEAFTAAKRAQKIWGATPWTERVAITKKAADIMRERRMRIAALMVLEVGKNMMERLPTLPTTCAVLAPQYWWLLMNCRKSKNRLFMCKCATTFLIQSRCMCVM
jgi:1-pyrroline-5-carboxylate dehydrogenase